MSQNPNDLPPWLNPNQRIEPREAPFIYKVIGAAVVLGGVAGGVFGARWVRDSTRMSLEAERVYHAVRKPTPRELAAAKGQAAALAAQAAQAARGAGRQGEAAASQVVAEGAGAEAELAAAAPTEPASAAATTPASSSKAAAPVQPQQQKQQQQQAPAAEPPGSHDKPSLMG